MEVNETQQQPPTNVYHDLLFTRNKIVTAQFECYQKIMQDGVYERQGKHKYLHTSIIKKKYLSNAAVTQHCYSRRSQKVLEQ